MTTAPSHATRAIIETKRIDGKPAHRVEGNPPDCWTVADSEIDAMLDRVKLQTGARLGDILCAVGIDSASISRCRAGKIGLPDRWLLGLSDFSGIPVAELRQVACVEPAVYPDLRARRPV
jgi:hypothetical protein